MTTVKDLKIALESLDEDVDVILVEGVNPGELGGIVYFNGIAFLVRELVGEDLEGTYFNFNEMEWFNKTEGVLKPPNYFINNKRRGL